MNNKNMSGRSVPDYYDNVRCLYHPNTGWKIPDLSNVGPREPRKLYVHSHEMGYRLVDARASGIDPEGLETAVAEARATEWTDYWGRLRAVLLARTLEWNAHNADLVREHRLRRATAELLAARERGDDGAVRRIAATWGRDAPPGSISTTEIGRPTADVRRAAKRLGIPSVGIDSYTIGHHQYRRDIKEYLWLPEDAPRRVWTTHGSSCIFHHGARGHDYTVDVRDVEA
jgi:hypothetical protein